MGLYLIVIIKNLAFEANYTLSQLYRQGGRDVEWGWDENAPVTYPDDGNDITDGKFAIESAYSDSAWVGFHSKCPDYAITQYHYITIDLGSSKNVTGTRVHVGTEDLKNGVSAPLSVEVFVSDNGENWTSIGSATPLNVTTEYDIATEIVEIEGVESGRYVQVRFTSDECWAFVSEVEILGY